MLGHGLRGRPLMAATQRGREPGRPPRRRRARAWPELPAALGVLSLGLASALLLYLLSPESRPAEPPEGVELGSEAELHALHWEPSGAACARAAPPLVCAHGGDASAAPPNTAAAFQAALDGGARCVEVDVSRTRDGVLVVLHARELARLLRGDARWGGPRRNWWGRRVRQPPPPQVGHYSWAELQRLRWPGGQRVELVESVLRQVLPHVAQVTLDVKTHEEAGEEVGLDSLAAQVADLATRLPGCGPGGERARGRGRCLVWAKSDALLRALRDRAGGSPGGGLRLGYVVMNETAQARAAGFGDPLRLADVGDVLALHYSMASPPLVARMHAAGLAVHVWTADTAGMMRAALDAGADAVVTSRPAEVRAALVSRAEACRRRRAAG